MVSRRSFMFSGSIAALTGAAALTSGPAFAASCSNVKNSSLGETLYGAAVDKLYGSYEPAQLQAHIGPDFWKAEEIEQAFEAAWEEIKICPAAREIITEAQAERPLQFEELTTDIGHNSESAVRAIYVAIKDYGAAALESIRVGQDGGFNFRYVQDRGLQAFLLNVQAKPELADQFDGVSSLVADKWQEGFSLFVENTLKPSIVPSAAPIAEPGVLKFQ